MKFASTLVRKKGLDLLKFQHQNYKHHWHHQLTTITETETVEPPLAKINWDRTCWKNGNMSNQWSLNKYWDVGLLLILINQTFLLMLTRERFVVLKCSFMASKKRLRSFCIQETFCGEASQCGLSFTSIRFFWIRFFN